MNRTFLGLVNIGIGFLMAGCVEQRSELPTDSQRLADIERQTAFREVAAWENAFKQGAPVFRTVAAQGGIPKLPEGKLIVIEAHGYALATNDIADVSRWYGMVTNPVVDYSPYPDVKYIYESKAARLVYSPDGKASIKIKIHESRTGCVPPGCDPLNGLPNYDREYEVSPASARVLSASSHSSEDAKNE